MRQFLRFFSICALPLFAFAALWIRRPGTRSNPGRPFADRVAWSVFALGIVLMFNMVLHAMASETDGDFRSWETIRLHGRLFLGFALIAFAGPLFVFLRDDVRTPRLGPRGKKPPADDLE